MLATHRGFEYHTQQVEKSLERKNHEKDSHVCYRLFRLGPHEHGLGAPCQNKLYA